MASTYEKIATQTLSSNQGAITFSSIPQTYTDLRLVITGGIVDNGFTFGARVGNGSVDTGSNYSWTYIEGGGSSAYSNRNSNVSLGVLLNGTSSNNLSNVITVDFLNYSNTTTYKTWLCRAGFPTIFATAVVDLWRSTSAINTISVAETNGANFFNYGNMLAGTTFNLYGIKAA
jgi:hypothetical protein